MPHEVKDMYALFALICGMLTSVMVTMNGELSRVYGSALSLIILHCVGLACISVIAKKQNVNPFQKRCAPLWYVGGVMGIFTVMSTNYAYLHISMTSIVALGLLAQCLTSMVFDQFGWMGVPVRPFGLYKVPGLLLVLLGIVWMMTADFHLFAILCALFAGFNLVVSRTINAQLAEQTNDTTSTFFNYVTGLLSSVIFFVLMWWMRGTGGMGGTLGTSGIVPSQWYMYFGGMMGMVIVFGTNVVLMHLSGFSLSLLLFVGQMFTSIVIDWLLLEQFSQPLFLGSILVCVGLCIHLWLEKNQAQTN